MVEWLKAPHSKCGVRASVPWVRAAAVLTADLQRLVDLSKLNDNVRPDEIELAKKQVLQVRTAIENARLRLDSLRLIVEGVEVD